LTQLRQRLPQLLRFGTEDQRNQVQFQLHFWDFQETNRVLALNQLKTCARRCFATPPFGEDVLVSFPMDSRNG
jgi:hypothetical protein